MCFSLINFACSGGLHSRSAIFKLLVSSQVDKYVAMINFNTVREYSKETNQPKSQMHLILFVDRQRK